MSEVQEIRLNRVEVKLADTDDPIASRISWDPLKRGGASFTTQKFSEAPGRLTVTRTAGALAFALVFLLPGLGAVLIGAPVAFFSQDNLMLPLFLLVWGAIFSAAGYFLVRRTPLTFDASAGVYFRGKHYDPQKALSAPTEQGPLASIHALQVISERIQSSSRGGSRTYTSHELNLVFQDGERMNVMDHGGDVVAAARQLAAFLDVPVWKATY